MNIADVITADRVGVATDVHSRKRALQQLAQLLSTGAPYLTASEILGALVAREKLGSTAIGHGVAIPHARMNGLDECIGAVVRLPHAVDFEAADDQPVDLIVGIVVPSTGDSRHHQLLQALADMLAQVGNRTRLRGAHDGKALIDVLIQQLPTAAD